MFADGGLTAYGLNVLLIGIVPTFVGWWVFRAVRSVLPATKRSVVAASGVAAFVSVPVAAAAFAVLFAVGGSSTSASAPCSPPWSASTRSSASARR